MVYDVVYEVVYEVGPRALLHPNPNPNPNPKSRPNPNTQAGVASDMRNALIDQLA